MYFNMFLKSKNVNRQQKVDIKIGKQMIQKTLEISLLQIESLKMDNRK